MINTHDKAELLKQLTQMSISKWICNNSKAVNNLIKQIKSFLRAATPVLIILIRSVKNINVSTNPNRAQVIDVNHSIIYHLCQLYELPG